MNARRAAIAAALAALLLARPALFAERRTPGEPVIVDTDAGPDDLLAIAFLLSRPDVSIEAITVVSGNADVAPGTRNILRLLALAGRSEIPVYAGSRNPGSGTHPFPAPWRKTAGQLPGVTLPETTARAQRDSARDFLARRFADRRHPVRLLAIGPLTNVAAALGRVPASARAPVAIVMMGGALRVPGNLGDGGFYKTDNTSAEWNFYADPAAAAKVFSLAAAAAGAAPEPGGRASGAAGLRIRVVPLDATNQVRIDPALAQRLARARTPLGRFASQILAANRGPIRQGIYDAWDPLAAVALVDPAVVKTRCMPVEIRLTPPEEGRLVELPGGPANACIGLSADAAAFSRAFTGAFRAPAR